MKSPEGKRIRRWPSEAVVGVLIASGAAGLSATDPTLNTSLSYIGDTVVLEWSGASAVPYQVEASYTLTDWTNISPVMIGTGSQLSFTNPFVSQGGGFFPPRPARQRTIQLPACLRSLAMPCTLSSTWPTTGPAPS